MKAISIWQPWATWIVAGFKTIEVRRHKMFAPLVGQRIAIHATARPNEKELRRRMKWAKREASPYLREVIPTSENDPWWEPDNLTFGVIVGTVLVLGHRGLGPSDSLAALIDCSAGDRYGLFVGKPNIFAPPIPVKGALYAWDWDPPKGLNVKG